MSVPSHVLVVDPGKKPDPEIERALRSSGADVSFASGLEETLKLALSLLPAVIILHALLPKFDTWRLIAKIWASTRKGAQPPEFILLGDQVAKWDIDHFGPVRFSDRGHLKEAVREILTASHHGSAPAAADEAAWETLRDAVWARGIDRIKAEQDHMRRLGILDERGQPTSKDWPADMKPGSTTDVAT